MTRSGAVPDMIAPVTAVFRSSALEYCTSSTVMLLSRALKLSTISVKVFTMLSWVLECQKVTVMGSVRSGNSSLPGSSPPPGGLVPLPLGGLEGGLLLSPGLLPQAARLSSMQRTSRLQVRRFILISFSNDLLFYCPGQQNADVVPPRPSRGRHGGGGRHPLMPPPPTPLMMRLRKIM